MRDHNTPRIEPVQLTYAGILGTAVLIGFVFLFVGFALYATGALPSATPIDEVPELWHLSAQQLAERTSREVGWAWVAEITQGDQLAFAALVFFPAATLLLIIIASLLYARKRVWSYTIIAILEAIVLLVAATGVLGGGH